jgi:ABC-type multidrug transport system ATPase subunit
VVSILEIDSVIKSFGFRQILTDIYIRLQTGDILGIFGRNGTGKSTLLKIIFGTMRSERKFIRIDGRVMDRPYKINDSVCLLPQNDFVPKHFKLAQVVRLYTDALLHHTFFDDQLLNGYKNCKVAELSAGELRYFEIKLLLNTKAKFILLDEPFTGLSPLLIDEISTMIKNAAKTKGIILTDHIYRNVLKTANRYSILADGGITYIETKADLIKWGYLNESNLNVEVPVIRNAQVAGE